MLQPFTDYCSTSIIDKCVENRCKMLLDNYDKITIIKGEVLINEIKEDGRICDCVIFINDFPKKIILIVELKSKKPHHTQIIEKMQNTSRIVVNILKECYGTLEPFKFIPIALATSWDPSLHTRISNDSVNINGKKHNILAKRCGNPMYNLIEKMLS